MERQTINILTTIGILINALLVIILIPLSFWLLAPAAIDPVGWGWLVFALILIILLNVVVGVVMANGLRGQIFEKEHKLIGIYLIICGIFTIVGGGILLIVAGSQIPRGTA